MSPLFSREIVKRRNLDTSINFRMLFNFLLNCRRKNSKTTPHNNQDFKVTNILDSRTYELQLTEETPKLYPQ